MNREQANVIKRDLLWSLRAEGVVLNPDSDAELGVRGRG